MARTGIEAKRTARAVSTATVALLAVLGAKLVSPSTASAAERVIFFTNKMNVSIVHLQFSPKGLENWGDDQIDAGDEILPGEKVKLHVFDLSRSCVDDLQVGYADNTSDIIEKVDICASNQITIIPK